MLKYEYLEGHSAVTEDGVVVIIASVVWKDNNTVKFLLCIDPSKPKVVESYPPSFVTVSYLIADNFTIETTLDGTASIDSALKVNEFDQKGILFNAAIDGLESFLLAYVCTGADPHTEEMTEAIHTALAAIGNEFS